MSALLAPTRDEEYDAPRPGPSRRPKPAPAPRLAPMPFLVFLIGVLGLGLAGLLLLNTTLQGQAFETRSLHRAESELAYRQAELEIKLDQAAAPQELARRASALGYRANPYPIILQLPDGTVIGKPTRVDGDELPAIVVKTPEQLAAEQAARERRIAERAAKAAAEARAAAEAAREQRAGEEPDQGTTDRGAGADPGEDADR